MNIKLITAVAVVLQTAALGALAQDSTRRPATAQEEPGRTQGWDETVSNEASGAINKDKGMAREPVTTESFVQKAAITDMTEIQLARLAQQKSQDKDIKSYADRMIKDHTASSAKLKAAAAEENITVPAALDSKHQQAVEQLQALNGTAFDAEYRKHMEKDHHKAVALFESASQSRQVAEPVREFAKNTLPTIKTHRQLAETLDGGSEHDRDRAVTEDR